MGWGDKIHNAVEKLHGKGNEAAGEATGNDRLKAEGKRHQVEADLKQAGEKVKDAFKKHSDKLSEGRAAVRTDLSPAGGVSPAGLQTRDLRTERIGVGRL